MAIKIQDPTLKDKMMGYMEGKPEMEGLMPMVQEEWPAIETPEMFLENIKPVFVSWSPEERLMFVSELLWGASEPTEINIETPEMDAEIEME